jgi:hypothetical protein
MTEINWYKRFHGTAYDPKFTAAGLEAQSTHCNALGVWDALLETTSDREEDRGSLAKIDLRVVAAGLRLALEEVQRIWQAFVSLGMIAGGRVAKWAKRQGAAAEKLAQAVKPATIRKRRERARKARDPRQGELLLPIVGGTSVTSVTRRDTRVTERDNALGDRDSELDFTLSEESDARARARRSFASGDFQKFWEVYPHKVDPVLARAAFAAAVREGADLEEILAGVRRYCATKPADREWMNPANFLKRKRWQDQPASAGTTIEPEADDELPQQELDRQVDEALKRNEKKHHAAAA